ncbi:hypothetical protein IJG44_10580 [bacterium]|nr:hypothetical protein [bacterium]
MVSKISKIICTLFCAFILFSCMSHGNIVEVDDDSADTTPEVSDSETDEDFAADEDSAENRNDRAETDVLTDEDADFIEDYDTDAVADEDTDSDGDFDVFTDEDNDSTEDHDVVPDEEIEDTEPYDGDSVQIRIVAGNITSGNKQSYDPGHGIRIFQALKPDIALVQEMNYGNNSVSDYKNFAQEIVGTNYYAVDNKQKCNNNKCNIPNGIVSKYLITDSDSWDDPNINDRALLWAIIDIPGEKDIFAVSVHLHTGPESDQVTAAKLIVDEIAKVKEKNPGKYYYVVGGDFNGTAAVSSNGFGKNDTFYVAGPHPVDENGNGNTNAKREKHYDFVLADYPLHEFQIPVVYYSSKDPEKTKIFENGLVFDTRVYEKKESELNEYFYPAQKNDSGASSMQHMAVVKDFLIELK